MLFEGRHIFLIFTAIQPTYQKALMRFKLNPFKKTKKRDQKAPESKRPDTHVRHPEREKRMDPAVTLKTKTVKGYNYIGRLRITREESESRRVARLIKKQGLKFWDVDGVKILALNKKNAYRKYMNQKKAENELS